MKCDGTRALAGLGFLIHPPPPATPLSPIAYGRRASVMVVMDVWYATEREPNVLTCNQHEPPLSQL